MTIGLGRDICNNLEIAEKREWLVTNGLGGFACGTVADVLTRCYHGLLIAALNPPARRTLLVAKLDTAVEYNGSLYTLYTNRWQKEIIDPQGYLKTESFHLENTVPVWRYAFADALLEKRIWMEQGQNTTYVHFNYRRGTGPLVLTLTALVNYRDFHGGGQSFNPNMDISLMGGGVKITASPHATPFYIFISDGQVYPAHIWYYGFDLAVERYRGLSDRENHLHAVSFSVILNLGESVTVVSSTDAEASSDGEAALSRRFGYERDLLEPQFSSQPRWIQQLILAADQFIVARPLENRSAGKTIIAGYPWFGDWGRDTMISLPGLTLCTGRSSIARQILLTFSNYLDRGMLPNMFPDSTSPPQYNTIDAVLWFFQSVWCYYLATADEEFIAAVYPALQEVIYWHGRGTRYNICLDRDDGLIYGGAEGVQLTWMDAKVDDLVVTPRTGKAIEINALWYNALIILCRLGSELGKDRREYEGMAQHTKRGFRRFWNENKGYCYDVLDTPAGNDESLRPNQIFAVSLPLDDLLTPAQNKAIVDTCGLNLLTSYGLRSLAPHHPDYKGQYGGDRLTRDKAYHQGTVWGWLLGPFVEAHWKVYGNPTVARSFLEPMAAHLGDGCLGSLSEIFDGDVPHHPRGAFAQAWTVAEVLRVWFLLEAGDR
ncbi:MAG: hypothetical protein N5P05_002513 [Chroococcopsis gigantea SAG 12.99]|jgi:predicted glycogen debranching enzyme|nr:hypothetical protein [Chroococcopsis gigantea SAG 12.99]